MRITMCWLLTVAAFASGGYIFLSGFESMTTGQLWAVSFVNPLSMLLLNIQVYMLPKMKGIKNYYSRYKRGIENIFLLLSLIVFVIHVGVLLHASGVEVNLLLFIPICVGIAFTVTANTLPRFIVESEGSETMSAISAKYWNSFIRPISGVMFVGGIMLFLTVFLPRENMLFGFFTVLIIVILGLIYYASKIIQRIFHYSE